MVYYWKKIKYHFPYFRGGGVCESMEISILFFFEPFPNIKYTHAKNYIFKIKLWYCKFSPDSTYSYVAVEPNSVLNLIDLFHVFLSVLSAVTVRLIKFSYHFKINITFPFLIRVTWMNVEKTRNKFALLWGEAQLCLPYVCL